MKFLTDSVGGVIKTSDCECATNEDDYDRCDPKLGQRRSFLASRAPARWMSEPLLVAAFGPPETAIVVGAACRHCSCSRRISHKKVHCRAVLHTSRRMSP